MAIKPAPTRRDIVIVLSSNNTADIAHVDEYKEDSILASSIEADYCIPLADVKCYVGTNGKIFAYKADEESVIDTKNLAALEKSIVLSQVTNYSGDKLQEDKSKITLREIITFIIIFVLILAVMIK